jgi:cytochrome P450 PksS
MDFASQDFFRDPAAVLERLRAAGPVVDIILPIFGRVWMTTTQEMASRVASSFVKSRARAHPVAGL